VNDAKELIQQRLEKITTRTNNGFDALKFGNSLTVGVEAIQTQGDLINETNQNDVQPMDTNETASTTTVDKNQSIDVVIEMNSLGDNKENTKEKHSNEKSLLLEESNVSNK